MQNEKCFIMSLNETIFKIPFEFCQIFESRVYKAIINTKLYKVKSNVSEEVFNSFVKYITNKELPNINSENFFEYEELSNEFDIMKNLINFYRNMIKNLASLSLINRNQKLKAKLNCRKAKIFQKRNNYEQIIKILFNDSQLDTYFNLSSVKHQLFQSCKEENLEKLKILTKKEISQDGLSFILDEKNKTSILYHNIKAIGNVIIPTFIKYKKKKFYVTQICENAFKNTKGVKSIEFSNDSKISKIAKSSLSCGSLKKVTLPLNYEDFNSNIFCDSENLTQIVIDSKSGNFLFYEDTYLIGKEDSQSENYDVLFFARRDLEEAQIPSFIKRIAPFAFESCKKLTRISFQEDSQLKTIDKFAFFKSNLTTILIPSGVKRIGEFAFSQCYKLERFEFKSDSKLRSIGKRAFSMSFLGSFTVPPDVVRISDETFCECKNLSKIDFRFNSKLKSIGREAFLNTLIKSISFPSSLIQIGAKAFFYCSYLAKVDFPRDSQLLIIGKLAFFHSIIKSIFIPSSVLAIQEGFLSGTEKLRQITVDPNNRHFLNYQDKFLLGKTNLKSDNFDVLLYAFPCIEEVTIPPLIKRIAFGFHSCQKLRKVDFSQDMNLNSIEKYSFILTKLNRVTVPSQIEKIGKNAFALCSSLQKVEFQINSHLKLIDSHAFAWSPIQKIVLPPTVIKIGNAAFYNCYKLKKVEFMENSELKVICKEAFASSEVEQMMIPSSVTKIGENSFYGCDQLKSVTFSLDSKLKSINNHAFSGSSLNCIAIPQSVTEICDFAFLNCRELEIIEIPEKTKLQAFNIDIRIFKFNTIIMIPIKNIKILKQNC
ncbi:hypothetical protein M9Y10_043425 [Tritrichomonas musculus]|uniref:Surface antigen BspA-like n=1 Tax=Tritrichomonas musculus TaxID=1915356 RepID=A0ABR2JZN2_9EUKA